MRLITRQPLFDFMKAHPEAASSVTRWMGIAEASNWQNIAEVHIDYPSADTVKTDKGNSVTVFDLAGARRLIVAIHYDKQRIFILRLLAHKDYDRSVWKRTL